MCLCHGVMCVSGVRITRFGSPVLQMPLHIAMSDRAAKRYVRALGGEIDDRMSARAQEIADMESALAALVAAQASDRVTLDRIAGRDAAARAAEGVAASPAVAQLALWRRRLLVTHLAQVVGCYCALLRIVASTAAAVLYAFTVTQLESLQRHIASKRKMNSIMNFM